MIRRFFDWLELRLYLSGFRRLARLAGRFGTPIPSYDLADVIDPSQAGDGWSLKEIETNGPLKVIEFDGTFERNPTIDLIRDIAIPRTHLDIN